MKILQVITSLRVGGAEKLVVDMVPILKAKGHIVDIFVFDGIQTPFLQQLEDNGIRVIRYNEGASPYNPQNIFRLRKLILQYDIVHTHNTACQYYVALLGYFYSDKKVKLVTTEHSANNRRRNMFIFKHIDRWMYKQYNSIVAISDQARINLQNFLGNGIHIETIYNGIDLNRFINAEMLLDDPVLVRKSDDFVISMVAGFRKEKDQDTLIKSLKHLPENCILWLVGDGVRKSMCVDLAKHLGVSNRVVFAGIRTDIPNILKSSDVIVMSSHWEGLSLSSIEGMSVGKPFVASDVDGLHEIVDGFGILFPHKNSEKLSEIIVNLRNNPVYAKEISKKCILKSRDYDIVKCVNNYEFIYRY